MWVTSVYNASCCHCSAVSIADDTSSGEVSGPVVNVGPVGFTRIPSCCRRVAGTD